MNTEVARSWPAPVRALAHREFRFYFIGQAFSHLGKWIQQVALAWLVYHLTGSVSLLGLATFCALIPQLFLGPLAGAWADKHDKRRLLMIIMALLGAQSLVLAILTATHLITSEIIIGMSLLLGVFNSLENPLRQAMIGNFIGDRKDLPNGLALNAMLLNASRFAGPPLAGLLVASTGEAICFAINSLAFLAPMWVLYKVPGRPSIRISKPLGAVFREGFTYSYANPAIRMLMISVIATNITASSYATLLPVLAKTVFGGDAQTLGWLWGAAGVGAFAATIVLSLQAGTQHLKGMILGCTFASAFGLAASALTGNFVVCLVSLAVVGFGISASNVSSNISLQSLASDGFRGRVIAFYLSIRFGFEAVGGLIAGGLAALIGTQTTLILEGVVLAIVGIVLVSKRSSFDQMAETEPATAEVKERSVT